MECRCNATGSLSLSRRLTRTFMRRAQVNTTHQSGCESMWASTIDDMDSLIPIPLASATFDALTSAGNSLDLAGYSDPISSESALRGEMLDAYGRGPIANTGAKIVFLKWEPKIGYAKSRER